MTLPLSTTTVTVRRPTAGEDRYETASATPTVASGVAAHVSSPSGAELNAGGQQEQVDAVLLCEAGTDVSHYDEITDDTTGDVWTVAWTRQRVGLGLDHTIAGLRRVTGGANG